MMTLASLIPVLRRLPRATWVTALAILVMLFVWRWHVAKVEAAFAQGGVVQSRLDEMRVRQAATAAQAAQQALKSALAKRQVAVSKGTNDALLAKASDLSRRRDDLRMRWAAYRADQGGTGEGRAADISGTAAGADDAACAASGWVSFDTAAAAALAADTAIARDDAWRSWVTAQAAAWPE
jgi:hypothetical protein